MDIRFYDLEFNLLKILPEFTASADSNSLDIGYISCNVSMEFNGNGSFEIVFYDPELKAIVEEYKDNLMIAWGEFQGFLTGYQWNKGKYTIFGMHLNGLLKRRVIPKGNHTNGLPNSTVESVAVSFIRNYYDFLQCNDSSSQSEFKIIDTPGFSTDSYQQGDTVIQSLLNLDNAGYKISADIKNKIYYFQVLQSNSNSLMLSENNLNAYDFVESYDNKELVTHGWWAYTATDVNAGGSTVEEWGCTSRDVLNLAKGIYKIETVLSATTLNDATNELNNIKPFSEVSCNTKNIKFGVDYKLGDIIRYQSGNTVSYKMVTGIKMWHEKEYGEEPILSEV